MVSDTIKEKAINLASEIKETEEYKDMKQKEGTFKEDSEAQELLSEFQQKQQDLISKKESGEVDQEMVDELTNIQEKLKEKDSMVSLGDSYSKFMEMLGEVVETINNEIDFDIGELYRK